MKTRSLIVAYGQPNGHGLVIGNGDKIPWRLPAELRYFSDITKRVSEKNPKGIEGSPVIMGRGTYESLPKKFRPLPGRTNIILTRNPAWAPENDDDSIRVAHTLWEALDYAEQAPGDELFCIGGEKVYREMIDAIIFQKLYLTCVCGKFQGDKFFPAEKLGLGTRYKKIQEHHHQKNEENPFTFITSEYELIG